MALAHECTTMGTLPQDLSLPTSRNRPYSPTMSTVPTSWRHRDKLTSTHWVWVEHSPTREAGWYTQQAGTWLRYQPDDSVQTQSQVRRHEGQLVTTTPTTTIPSQGVLGLGLTPRTTTMKVGGHIPVKAGLAIPQDRLGLVASHMGALLTHPPPPPSNITAGGQPAGAHAPLAEDACSRSPADAPHGTLR